MRLFIAIEISESIRRALAQAIEELRRCGEKVKWVEEQNIHLTLKFLGEMPDESAEDVETLLRECCRETAAFRLTVAGTGAFPNLGRPKVLWVKAVDEPRVMAGLAARLNKEYEALNVPSEEREFKGHITLGRMRIPRPAPRLAKKLEALSDSSFGQMVVSEALLMKSDLTAEGPIYTVLARAPLGMTT